MAGIKYISINSYRFVYNCIAWSVSLVYGIIEFFEFFSSIFGMYIVTDNKAGPHQLALWILCCDALPHSYRDSMVSKAHHEVHLCDTHPVYCQDQQY